jgi:hypothetical protein
MSTWTISPGQAYSYRRAGSRPRIRAPVAGSVNRSGGHLYRVRMRWTVEMFRCRWYAIRAGPRQPL